MRTKSSKNTLVITFIICLLSIKILPQKTKLDTSKIKSKKEKSTINKNPFLDPKSYEQDLNTSFGTTDFGKDITPKSSSTNSINSPGFIETKPSSSLAIVLITILVLGIIIVNRKKGSKIESNTLIENMKEEKNNNTSGWGILIVVILVSWGIGGIIDGKDFSYGVKSNISALFSLITIAIIGIFIYNAFFKK